MYNVYITNQLQTTFAQGGRGKIRSREDFCPNYVQEFGLRLGFSLLLFNEFLLGETMVAERQEEVCTVQVQFSTRVLLAVTWAFFNK